MGGYLFYMGYLQTFKIIIFSCALSIFILFSLFMIKTTNKSGKRYFLYQAGMLRSFFLIPNLIFVKMILMASNV